MRNLKALLLTLILSLSVTTTGCIENFMDLISTPEGCQNFELEYQQSVNDEGKLLDTINPHGDFSMALVLNARSINKLFKAATVWNYDLNIGLGSLKLQLPTIQVGGCRPNGSVFLYEYTGNIDNCLTMTIPAEGSIIGFGEIGASITFGVPVEAVIHGTQKSSINIDLKRAQLLHISGKAGGSGGSLNTIVVQGIETAIKLFFSDKLTTVNLFDIQAWEIGDKQIKMLAGGPRVNQAKGTLTLGMYSNLYYTKTATVEADADFPTDAEIGIHIHPDLIRGLIARMMYEGHISRETQLGSASDPQGGSNGGFKVTLANMGRDYPQDYLLALDDNFKKYFTLGFRLWKTNDTFCGYMDLLAGIQMSISDQQFSVGLGNIRAGKSAGAMTLFASIINTIVDTPFFKQVLQYTNISLNFNEITVGEGPTSRKAAMESKHIELNLNGNGISLFLNFLDL